jgi:hypothetical protein
MLRWIDAFYEKYQWPKVDCDKIEQLTISQGDCSHHATSELETSTRPSDRGVSPSKPFNSVLLPQATGPVIMIMLDAGTQRLTFLIVSWSSSFQPKEALCSVIASARDKSAPLVGADAIVLVSQRAGVCKNFSRRVKQPIAERSSMRPPINMNRGSDARRIRANDVNSLVVSSSECVLEETPMYIANVRTGAMSCGTFPLHKVC